MRVNGNCVFKRLCLSFFFNVFLWLISDIIKIIFIQLWWALHLFLKRPHNPSFKCYLYLAALGLLAALAASGSSSLVVAGFSLQRFLWLWRPVSRVRAPYFRRKGLARFQHGTWNLPGTGIEPESPKWAGGFLTTGPPGKSLFILLELSF